MADGRVSTRTRVLALASLPAGLIGYLVAAELLRRLGAGDTLVLILPVLAAGLCMAPFLIPFFDQLARRDLAALRAQREPASREDDQGERIPD